MLSWNELNNLAKYQHIKQAQMGGPQEPLDLDGTPATFSSRAGLGSIPMQEFYGLGRNELGLPPDAQEAARRQANDFVMNVLMGNADANRTEEATSMRALRETPLPNEDLSRASTAPAERALDRMTEEQRNQIGVQYSDEALVNALRGSIPLNEVDVQKLVSNAAPSSAVEELVSNSAPSSSPATVGMFDFSSPEAFERSLRANEESLRSTAAPSSSPAESAPTSEKPETSTAGFLDKLKDLGPSAGYGAGAGAVAGIPIALLAHALLGDKKKKSLRDYLKSGLLGALIGGGLGAGTGALAKNQGFDFADAVKKRMT